MKTLACNLLSKNTLFLLCLLSISTSYGQVLTIISSGQTGTSGTNWSISSNTLNVTGTANIQASVIENHLTNTGPLTIVGNTTPSNLQVSVNEVINVSSGNNSLVIGASDNKGAITTTQTITLSGSISFHGGFVRLENNVVTTSSGAKILAKANEPVSPVNATDGFISLLSGKNLTTNGGDIILWSNATNKTSGQANNEIILLGTNTLSTSGGKIVIAGGLDDGSNGGTASDGIPDGYAYRGSYGGRPIDIKASVTLNSGGGEIIIRGEQNGSDAAVGADATFTISNGGAVTIEGKNTTATSVVLGTANIASTATNAPVTISGTTHITNSGLTTISTQGGDVLLASNVDDATDGEDVINGYIRMLSGLSVTTNGGAITVGGGNATGTAYALGSTASTAEGIRIDGTVNLNSGNGNIALRGKSDAVALANDVGGGAIMFYNVTNGSINSGTGTILLDGYSQTTVGNAIAGLLWWNNPTASSFTIQSANTTSSAITLNGYSTSSTGQSYGIEVEATNTLNVYATGAGGGISINGGRAVSNTTPNENLDIVFRGPVNILANSGPISIKGGQLGGVSNGYWFTTLQTQIGSKASTAVASSASDITIAFDRFWLDATYFPKLATSGTVSIAPLSVGFGMGVSSAWFKYNQNGQTMTGLTLGKAGNTADISHEITAITVAGPISVYGGNIGINANLNTSAGLADGDVLLKASGNNNLANGKSITTSGGDVTFWSDSDGNGTGYAQVGSSTAITTAGGNITLGGGSDIATGYARGAAEQDTETETVFTLRISGVHLKNGTSLSSGGGNITLRGQNYESNGGLNFGVMGHNATLNAGSGKVAIIGKATGSGISNSQAISVYDNGWTIRSSNSDADAIVLDGDGSGYNGTTTTMGINFAGIIESTGGGGIQLIGKSGTAAGYDHPLDIYGSILANSGTITITAENNVATQFGLYLSGANFGFKAATNVTASTSNIILKSDNTVFNSATNLNTTGAVSLLPLDASTSFGVAQTIGSNMVLSSGVSGLTIGKSGNTADITMAQTQTIAGPITLHGGALAINAALTATGDNINMHATGNVTQNAALIADGLGLHGTGNFTLTNTGNNVATLAGGDATTKLGSLSFVDASGGLTIGTVNPTGITATGDILIETLTGDILLTEPITTTSSTTTATGYAGAIVLNAGKSVAAGSITGGDIKVSGNGSVSAINGITKLYSGGSSQSTGLNDLVGGSTNTRSGVDEGTTNFSPALSSTGGSKYALYRVSQGTGDLTIVATGGDALNSKWTYANGVITTHDSPVNINASVVESYLATGDLTIEAGNIWVSTNVNSTSANALTLKSLGLVNLNNTYSITTAGGDVTFWADSDGSGAGYVQIGSSTGIATAGGNITLGGGSDIATGYARGAADNDGVTDINNYLHISGVHLKNGASLSSGGGNITLRGQNYPSSGSNAVSTNSWGVMGHNATLDAGSGKVAIIGKATGSGTSNSQAIGVYGNGWTIRSSNSDADAIVLNGDGSGYNGDTTTIGINFAGIIESTGGGDIQLIGKSGTAAGYDHPLDIYGSILANSGTITITAENNVATQFGLYLSGATFGFKAATNVTASTSNIILKSDNTVFNSATNLNTTGAVSLLPLDASTSFGVAQTIGSNMVLSSGVSGLTIGKSGNTANITMAQPQNIAGPITLYGGTLTLNTNLTTTNGGDISLYTDNNLGGLSSARTITADGAFKLIPNSTSFSTDISYPIINLNVSSNGLTIGKIGNTPTITMSNDLTISGSFQLLGDALALDNNITCTNIELSGTASGTATLAKGKYINASGNMTNNTKLILSSDSNEFSRLKVDGTVSGSGAFKYQRWVAGSTTNDLISSPFPGETFGSLVTNNPGVLRTNPSEPNQHLFGPFDNNVNGVYETYWSTTNSSTPLTAGEGYRAGTENGATLEFTGTYLTSNQTTPINLGSHNTYGKWNLVGNPFPTYLDLYGFIDDNDNTAILDPSNTAVYAYDGNDSDGSTNWDIYNLANSNGIKIAPGQAFFVASSSGGGNLTFNTSRQTIEGGDDFLPGLWQTPDAHAVINLKNTDQVSSTDLYINANGSLGLDPGYDAGTYANESSDFSLYTKLADGSYPDTKFAIQTIADDLSQTVVIPLGVHINAGTGYSIALDDNTLLELVRVYLKDNATGAFTLLNDGAYIFETDVDLEGALRFELHLSDQVTLGIPDESFTSFKTIYHNHEVLLVGVFQSEDTIEIYDLMGRLTQEYRPEQNGFSTLVISDQSKASGIYIARINREGTHQSLKFLID